MANCNHGPLHAPIMGNTPVGICTKQHVEVAVIHSYHPILHTISTLLPSRYHIQSSSVVHHWSFFSIICHYHPLSCSQSSSVAVSPTSNSPNQEKALGVPFHHPWCVCCTSLALHYCYWHDSAPWVTAGGSWRLEGSSSSALGMLVALFRLPMPILGFVFCLVSILLSSSCLLIVIVVSSSRHPYHVFGLVVIFGSSCHHRDGLSVYHRRAALGAHSSRLSCLFAHLLFFVVLLRLVSSCCHCLQQLSSLSSFRHCLVSDALLVVLDAFLAV